ncbi:hypothetical protein VYU27_003229 [Nannochloropsis oceanica]
MTAQHGKRIAVIENEFGEVGVDDSLVKRKDFGTEDIVEMNNGCICCTVRGDLIRILTDLFKRKAGKFDHILIETTGLADPAPVAQTFFVHDELQSKLRLDAILTVVDSKHLIQHLDDPRPEGVENEAVEQLAFADRVLLNKIDLATDAELMEVEKRIKAVNNFAPIIRTQNAVVNLDKVLDLKAFDLKRVLDFDPEFLGDQEHEHDQSVTSVGFRLAGDMNLGQLERWLSVLLRDKGTELFRYKGVLSVKGFDAPWIFQGVHMLFGASMDDQEWKCVQDRTNRFVFIGRNLNRTELTEGFAACLVTKPLRFEVGTRVRCHVDENQWELGEVIKQWNDGNPYRVRLHNGIEIWAPIDNDGAIRLACRAETRMNK